MPHHICFYDDRRIPTPHCIVLGFANGGSESCIFGIPWGQVVIGSASLGLERGGGS